jgi:uncharacterized membrane protein (GlpM family)
LSANVLALLIRFVLGGAVVSLVAAFAASLRSKAIAGILGAAPTIALVSLASSAQVHKRAFVTEQGYSMMLGAVALLVYCASAAALLKAPKIAAPLAIALPSLAWLLTAGLLHELQVIQ